MVNNISKMHRSNYLIKKHLAEMNYQVYYVVPHTRFQKDICLETLKFDAIGIHRNNIFFAQFRTNKKPSKRELLEMRDFTKRYGVEVIWAAFFNRVGVKVYT